MQLVSDYMRDETLRHRLNALTRQTYGFDFEGWVTSGYFEGDYIPYSFLDDSGVMRANISANRMQFLQNGVRRNYIQIGTVMADASFRRRGLARTLMEYVLAQYESQCDGVYLFANLGALDFYRKLGFYEGREYQYTLRADARPAHVSGGFVPVDPADAPLRQRYLDTVRHGAVTAALEQENKFGLQLFYTAGLEDVYYAADLDCFAVLKQDGELLRLQSVISFAPVPLREVLARIPLPYASLQLGFAPLPADACLFEAAVYDGSDDYRLFFRGAALERIAEEMLLFPALSHA